MPELPEVETIRRTLEPTVVGRRVGRLEVRSAHCWQGPRHAVADRRIAGLTRRGKYLVALLDGGWALVVHLRMTGRLVYLPPRGRWRLPPRHTHAVVHLEGGGRLVFYDVRKFGRLTALPAADLPAALPAGRDPLLDRVDAGYLAAVLAGRRGPVKPLLLRQDLVAGLGNIYADEALWRAGIHPRRPAGGLRAAELRALAASIGGVLAEALAHGGTTLLDYRDGRGRPGAFAARLAVYGREGEACRRCGSTVERCTLAGRSSHFCAGCQRPEGAAGSGAAAGGEAAGTGGEAAGTGGEAAAVVRL